VSTARGCYTKATFLGRTPKSPVTLGILARGNFSPRVTVVAIERANIHLRVEATANGCSQRGRHISRKATFLGRTPKSPVTLGILARGNFSPRVTVVAIERANIHLRVEATADGCSQRGRHISRKVTLGILARGNFSPRVTVVAIERANIHLRVEATADGCSQRGRHI